LRELVATGRKRCRIGWWGRLILQYEFTYESDFGSGNLGDDIETRTVTCWRDATVEDLQALGL
jgi:hypothetical protein